ncbi:hypothetical protein B0A50_01096 [Salinomyces thailandicus]|uniref:F-box domain-containing protein n=1 Tax=Salinomyces thailandicus TaxID=706561 RepID=A0A4U0UBP5_9PEZI|nr:hypothetical protein B0A50_01096 [Salinomyces thailandica]
MPDLPEELLQAIITHLPPTSSTTRPTLLALCRTSKTFHRLATQTLYHTLDLRPQPLTKVSKADYVRHWETKDDSGFKTAEAAAAAAAAANRAQPYGLLPELLVIFARNPTLASHVREIHLGIWLNDVLRLPANYDTEALVRAASFLGLPAPLTRKLEAGLRALRRDAMIALLLALCGAHLETLRFRMGSDVGFEESVALEFVAAAAAAGAEGGLPRLERVLKVEHREYDEDGTELAALAPFFALPSVKVFEGEFMVHCRAESLEYSARTTHAFLDLSRPSTMQSLTLTLALVDDSGLDALLRSCPVLQSLSIEFASETSTYLDVRFYDIGDLLRRWAPQLRRLRLGLEADLSEWRYEDEPRIPGLGSLISLEGLQELAVPVIALFGAENGGFFDCNGWGWHFRCDEDSVEDIAATLPPALRKLEVSMTNFENFEVVERMMRNIIASRDPEGGSLSVWIDGEEVV